MPEPHLIHPVGNVLGKEAGVFAHLLERLIPELDGVVYEFMDGSEFGKLPPPAMNRVYWTEILFRSHWVAAGTIVRAHRWLSGFSASFTEQNLLAAAACARGLIEAAADAEHALSAVPSTLARDFRDIRAAVEGEHLRLFVNSELEARLIHFTHARKPNKGENVPASHVARQVVQYRTNLDKLNSEVATCYAQLCDLTHPGASSVLSFAEAITPNASRVRFSVTSEADHLAGMQDRLKSVMPDVLMLGLNPAFVTLKLLNRFPMDALHTHEMTSINLDEVPLWRRVVSSIEGTG